MNKLSQNIAHLPAGCDAERDGLRQILAEMVKLWAGQQGSPSVARG